VPSRPVVSGGCSFARMRTRVGIYGV